MRIYLILNLIMAVLIFGIIFAYDYEESSNWLLFLTLALSVFFNLKIIANIRKYWNSRKYFGKSVLGTLIVVTEDLMFLPWLISFFIR